MHPKVSIIVPVYNSEGYLNNCINSILNQTYKDFELILVDDGSTDNSGEICNYYENGDNRVRVIHKSNEGVSTARNVGIDIAKGEYIMFVDSDDWIEINAIETLMDHNINGHSDVVIFGLTKDLTRDNKLIKSEFNGFYKKHKMSVKELSNNFIYFLNSVGMHPSCMYLFKSKIILNNKIYFNSNLVLYEDFDFNLRYLKSCNKVTFIPNALYHYNINTSVNQLAKRKKQNIVPDISTVCHSLFDFLQQTGVDRKVITQGYPYILPMYTLCLKNIIIHRKSTNLRHKFEVLKQIHEDKLFKLLISEYGNTLRFYRLFNFFTNKQLYLLAYLLLWRKFK
jgi:glycosyltransferase involved in cell wall biosynthesis